MKIYLSNGLGINSVATTLLLNDEGIEFESVYVYMDDLPETHDYLKMLQSNGFPVTVIMPKSGRFTNLYDECWEYRMFPGFKRWCTVAYKIEALARYYQKPCFDMVGFATDEIKRAKYMSCSGIEKRYPLLEREISRKGCIEIIKSHGLPVPPKSGCFFCPQQSPAQWRKLRRDHPDLWCKALALENRVKEKKQHKNLSFANIPLEQVIESRQKFLIDEMVYPPCQCGL